MEGAAGLSKLSVPAVMPVLNQLIALNVVTLNLPGVSEHDSWMERVVLSWFVYNCVGAYMLHVVARRKRCQLRGSTVGSESNRR